MDRGSDPVSIGWLSMHLPQGLGNAQRVPAMGEESVDWVVESLTYPSQMVYPVDCWYLVYACV